MLTRHQTTWQNPEEDHHWDAWLPGGPQNRGFWFSPLSIAAEFTHGMHKYMANGENALDSAVHIASNKLSGPARGIKDLVTGEDWRGQPFASMGERLKAAAVDTLPSPLPLSGTLERDPKAMLGYGLNHQPGALEKQGLSMIGMRVDAAKSARSQMYDVARQYRPGGNMAAQAHPASPYGDLRHAADNENQAGTASEIMRLVTKEGHTIESVLNAVGWKGGQKPNPEYYTGTKAGDLAMVDHLTPAQIHLYGRAQAEHAQNAVFVRHTLADMLRDPDQRRVLALASMANRKGNRGLAKTLGNATAVQPSTP